METATWCRTPATASAARRVRPETSKNSSTALSSHEGELARSITTCAPAMASLRPSPVMLLTPVLGEAATISWPPWRRMGAVFEPIRPVPPIMTIFIATLLALSHRLVLGVHERPSSPYHTGLEHGAERIDHTMPWVPGGRRSLRDQAVGQARSRADRGRRALRRGRRLHHEPRRRRAGDRQPATPPGHHGRGARDRVQQRR